MTTIENPPRPSLKPFSPWIWAVTSVGVLQTTSDLDPTRMEQYLQRADEIFLGNLPGVGAEVIDRWLRLLFDGRVRSTHFVFIAGEVLYPGWRHKLADMGWKSTSIAHEE